MMSEWLTLKAKVATCFAKRGGWNCVMKDSRWIDPTRFPIQSLVIPDFQGGVVRGGRDQDIIMMADEGKQVVCRLSDEPDHKKAVCKVEKIQKPPQTLMK